MLKSCRRYLRPDRGADRQEQWERCEPIEVLDAIGFDEVAIESDVGRRLEAALD